VTEADCYTCAREAELDRLPPRERIALDEHWRVVHATGSGLLGWLVLTPRRHVMELADLTDDEARGLGDWQVRLARALTAELGAAKVYVAEFGEKPGFHLHFHVVPRAADLAAERRGPGCFDYLNQDAAGEVTAEARDALAQRLAVRLAS
jgi:diadenosine tetraphosphate (Ap4A) HIT family hydrolase